MVRQKQKTPDWGQEARYQVNNCGETKSPLANFVQIASNSGLFWAVTIQTQFQRKEPKHWFPNPLSLRNRLSIQRSKESNEDFWLLKWMCFSSDESHKKVFLVNYWLPWFLRQKQKQQFCSQIFCHKLKVFDCTIDTRNQACYYRKISVWMSK